MGGHWKSLKPSIPNKDIPRREGRKAFEKFLAEQWANREIARRLVVSALSPLAQGGKKRRRRNDNKKK
jgi:hypothetical protein